jgi:hypothetical protein
MAEQSFHGNKRAEWIKGRHGADQQLGFERREQCGHEDKGRPAQGGPEQIYAISDLGASFGTTGRSWTRAKSKGNFRAYTRSKFISKVTPAYVDFKVPSRPAVIHLIELPEYVSRLRMRWLGRRIPRNDARWIGQLLAHLSADQVRAAFRAGGYSLRK